MNLLGTFKIALLALLRNKLRSALTALGVLIGVGAVICMVAIGEGAKAQVQQAFDKMGTNMLVVRSGSSQAGGARGGAGSQPSLTWDDVDAIRTEITPAPLVAPQMRQTVQVLGDGQNWSTSVEGTTPEYFAIRGWKLERGAAFEDADVTTKARVAVVGQTVIDNVFGRGADGVGETLRINGMPFTIVGVLEQKGQAATGQDLDDVVEIPVTTFAAKISGGLQKYLRGSIYVGAASSAQTKAAQAQIEELLRRRHRVRGDDDFSVMNLEEAASARAEGTEVMTRLLAGIALVSLVVGGIGIMNIMLVSVTERTREIGLRLAIGAKPRHVLAQFVIEAMTLSTIGGAAGLALGSFAAHYLGDRFGWAVLVEPSVAALALGVSAVIGVGFGLYPAHKASQLDPITALRFE